ncbi:ATP-binding protein [Streptomyces sp. NPDC126514]|uniref:ATP-binding protein n=1 Tax=Streptomyces sp. NPDC126514 TaxID=3155210 RepID=UPI00331831C8
MYATLPGTPPETAGAPPQHVRATGRSVPRVPTASGMSGDSARTDGRTVTVTRDLEPTPRSVSSARHLTEDFLGHSHTDAAEAVVLVVSELVTNAIEHAEPPIMLHLHRESSGNRIWVGVTDGGPAPHKGPWTSSCTETEHGRGLAIVDTLADAHGTRDLPDGNTTHWARLHAA